MIARPSQSTRPRRLLLTAAFAGAFATAGLTMAASPALAQAKAPAAAQPPAPAAQTPAPASNGQAPSPAAKTPTPAAQAPASGGHGGMAGMGDKLDQTLTKVGATDDQKAKVKSIMLGAVASLMPLEPKVKQMPRDLQRMLTAPTIDRAGLEQLRVALVADFDLASKTLVAALADAAAALTPEQRAKLAAQFGGKPQAHP
jgi:Spy/CpxP family protein refolding chaperone